MSTSTRKRLFSRYIQDLPPGELTWIGLRPERKAAMVEVESVHTRVGSGLVGDHGFENTLGAGRQVTLVSEEYIAQIEHFLVLSRSANLPVHRKRLMNPFFINLRVTV